MTSVIEADRLGTWSATYGREQSPVSLCIYRLIGPSPASYRTGAATLWSGGLIPDRQGFCVSAPGSGGTSAIGIRDLTSRL